jgi:hypothetical protein
MIDFGVLSHKIQFSILHKLFASPKRKSNNSNYLKDVISLWESELEAAEKTGCASVEKNRKTIREKLAGRSFDKRFKECFDSRKRSCDKRGKYNNQLFLEYFSSLNEFRLLMSNS